MGLISFTASKEPKRDRTCGLGKNRASVVVMRLTLCSGAALMLPAKSFFIKNFARAKEIIIKKIPSFKSRVLIGVERISVQASRLWYQLVVR